MPASLGFFDVMAAPLLLVLLFAAVLSYLGVHIIRRKVIFVDLALGQTAALGATVGFLFGLHPSSMGAYLFSLGFAVAAAAVFAVTRPRAEGPIPHEAVIGLVFAVAAAAGYLVVDRSAHGAEHVHAILTGTVLWTSWGELGRAALAIVAAGGLLLALHPRLRALSLADGEAQGEEVARASRSRPVLWDFVFYSTFGLVISVTVRTAGVLPTFAMLVAPAILGCLIARRFAVQLGLTVAFSATAAVGSLLVAWALDWPGGPPLVLGQGVVLLVGALVLYVLRAQAPRRALMRLALGAAVVALVAVMIVLGGRLLARSNWSNPALASPPAQSPGGPT